MEHSATPKNIKEYIACYPQPVRERLQEIYDLVKKSAPEAEEKISYGMPAFTLHGMLLYYAAHTNHIGLYPLTTAVDAFREDLLQYKTAKGSIQFPHNKPLPVKLISQIINFRVTENRAKAELKAQKKSKSKKK